MASSLASKFRKVYGGLSANIWLLALVTLVNRSGTMVVPFLTIYLSVEKGFTLGQTGWIMGLFGAGSLLGTFLGGKLTDRWGFYGVQFVSLFGSGLLFLLLGWLDSYWALCAGVFVLSTVADAFRPANLTAVGAYSSPGNLTRSMSVVRMAMNLGWSIGPAVGGFLAAGVGYSWLFIADGVTCMLSALMMLVFLPPRKANAVRHTHGETDPDAVQRPPHRDRQFMVFFAMMVLVGLAFMQFIYTLPVYFKTELGLGEEKIGLLQTLNALLIVIMEVGMVYLLENRYEKLSIAAVGAFLIALAFLVLNLNPSWVFLSVVCMILLTFGEMLNFPFANTYAISRSSERTRGQYMAFYTMSFSLASVVAPTVGLPLAGAIGFRGLWYLTGGVGILSALGLWWARKVD